MYFCGYLKMSLDTSFIILKIVILIFIIHVNKYSKILGVLRSESLIPSGLEKLVGFCFSVVSRESVMFGNYCTCKQNYHLCLLECLSDKIE